MYFIHDLIFQKFEHLEKAEKGGRSSNFFEMVYHIVFIKDIFVRIVNQFQKTVKKGGKIDPEK